MAWSADKRQRQDMDDQGWVRCNAQAPIPRTCLAFLLPTAGVLRLMICWLGSVPNISMHWSDTNAKNLCL